MHICLLSCIGLLWMLILSIGEPHEFDKNLHTAISIKSQNNLLNYELSALYDLYNATSGNNWKWTAGLGNPWIFSSDCNPCIENWQGVNCTTNSSYLHIHSLTLENMNLNGTLPTTISSLSYMALFSVANNKIHGTIPESIGNWSFLQSFSIYTNQISGTIPLAFTKLFQLRILQFNSNRFTGTISSDFKYLTYLTDLDLQNNALYGTLPDELSSITSLYVFTVNNNYFYGTLPYSYGNLTNLQYFYCDSNKFTGTIPSTYMKLSKLVSLSLYNNQLTGPLLDIFSNMVILSHLTVDGNYLTGTLPDSLGALPVLSNLYIDQNYFNGSIPSSWGALTTLSYFYCYDNFLTGVLPEWLGNNTQLLYLICSNNQLTGTLPQSYGQLTDLVYFELDTNYLSGTLPPTLGNLTILYLFTINNNYLTGTIPYTYNGCKGLIFLDISYNSLTGTLSESIFPAMSSLYDLSLEYNDFTGSLPTTISTLTDLVYLNCFHNILTGILHRDYGNLSSLVFLFLDQNYLSGSIPNSYSNMIALQQLFLTVNLLTGQLPEYIGNIKYLQMVDFSVNLFTGTVPKSIAQLEYLLELFLNNNQFTGSLEDVFSSTMQTQLVTIVLNNNEFTGTLPEEIFLLPALNSFTAVSNCFRGQIPASVCSCPTLVALALDGLSSAAACRNTLFPRLSGSYVTDKSLSGQIPSCIFTLPILTTLHLSGNGLTGTLPGDISIAPYLVDLSLSHNLLTGTIPHSIQYRKWYNLDLSFNRLSGSLKGDFSSERLNTSYYEHLSEITGINITVAQAQSSLSLETNRLSGNIPRQLRARHNISILGSNVFNCDIAQSNLPEHDSGRGNYQCGSDSFNVPYYFWLGLVMLTGTATLLAWRWQAAVDKYVSIDYALSQVRKWRSVLDLHSAKLGGGRLQSFRSVLHLSEALCIIAVQCTVYMVVVLVPIYAACTYHGGTLLHQYAWIVSAAYLSGPLPAALMLTFLLLLLLIPLYGFRQYLSTMQTVCSNNTTATYAINTPESSETHQKPPQQQQQSTLLMSVVYVLFLTMNLVVVVGANTAYVYIAIYGQSNLLLLAQLLLSCFKLFWNRFFSVYLIRWTARLKVLVSRIQHPHSASTDTHSVKQQQQHETAQLQLATATDSQFVSLQIFVGLLNNIAVPCLVVAGVSPSCFYNVFVVAPEVTSVYTYDACAEVYEGQCVQFQPAEITTSYRPPFTYNYQCSSSFITYYAPTFVLLCLMRAFASPLLQLTVYTLHRRSQAGTRWHAILHSLLLPGLKAIVPEESAQTSVFKPYFDANQLLLSLFTYLGLLLTFGAVFPPVSLALLLTIFAVLQFNKLKVNWLLSRACELNRLEYADIIEAESKRAGFAPVLDRGMWMLLTVSCLFYTLFVFDTLGDAVGFQRSYWVLIVLPLMPVVLYVLWGLYEVVVNRGWSIQHQQGQSSTTSADVDCENIELHTTTTAAGIVRTVAVEEVCTKEVLNVLLHTE